MLQIDYIIIIDAIFWVTLTTLVQNIDRLGMKTKKSEVNHNFAPRI